MIQRGGWLGVAWWLLAVPAQALATEQNGQALVTGDYVRVRAEPSLTAPQLGFLYKNLRVQVLEKSATTSMIDGKAQYWYRVRQDNVEGWCSSAFLTFNIPSALIDTYAAPAAMDWFYARYGGSTDYQDNTFNADSFTVDEYRRLMAATIQSGSGSGAPLVLKLSIYRHLQKRPEDPAHQYLKTRLYSQEFLFAMLNAAQFDVLPLLPRELAMRTFTGWGKESGRFSSSLRSEVLDRIPESAALLRRELAGIMLVNASSGADTSHDRELVLQAVAGDGLLLMHAAPKLRDDFEVVMTAVKNNHSALQWASPRLKADERFKAVVGKQLKKAVHSNNAPRSEAEVSAPGMAIKAPDAAENGSVVPFAVTISPPIGSGDVLTVMANANRVCDIRPAGDVVLTGFSARVRMSGSGEIRAIVVRKNGARSETARRVNITVPGTIPDGGNDNRDYKMKDRPYELLVLINNPMGRHVYVNNILLSLQSGSVVIDSTPWFSANPLIGIKTPTSLIAAVANIAIKRE